MEWYKFVDLSIVSAKKPQNTHLWWETDAGGLYIVLSTDNTEIWYSADKGSSWAQIDVDPSDSSGDTESRDYNIQSGWHDRTNKIIYFVDCTYNAGANDFDFWKLDYSSSESSPTTTEVGSHTGSYRRYCDIFRYSGSTYVFCTEAVGGSWGTGFYSCDANPATALDVQGTGIADETTDIVRYYGLMIGDTIHVLLNDGTLIYHNSYDIGTDTADWLDWQTGIPAGYSYTDNDNQYSVAYDNSNILYAIFKKNADSKNYLFTYSVSGNVATIQTENNVAIMADRNTASGVLEKGFHISNYEVYQIRPKLDGIFKLEEPPSDAVFIGITDNFLINNDGDMFENQNSASTVIDKCIIDYKMGNTTHAKFAMTDSLSTLDTVIFNDDSGVLLFEGIVTEKIYTDTNLYEYIALSHDMEIVTYKFNYDATAGVNAKTAIEAILDNANWLYYSSSITDPSITIYADFQNISFKDAMEYIADVCDYVWYVAPDGKVYFNAGTTLSVANTGDYLGTYTFAGDANGANPDGWTIVETGGTINVISDLGGHNKVVEMDDTGGAALISMAQLFTDGTQTSGTVEFWINSDDVTDTIEIKLRNTSGTSDTVHIKIAADKIQYYYSAGWNDATGGGVSNDTWYHFRIVFDCSTDTYDFYLDNIKLDADIAFANADTDIEYIIITSNSGESNYKYYIDSIAYSWTSQYSLGANQYTDIVDQWNNILSPPQFKLIGSQINKVILYGGYVDGTRLTATSSDTTAQQLYGVQEYIDHYPQITDQIELDTLAATVRARDGMNNSPYYIDLELYGLSFKQTGTTINLAFTVLGYYAASDIILSYKYAAKRDQGKFRLSTGLVQNVWRGYGTYDSKTKISDEAQLDKIGTRLGSDFDMHYDVVGTANAQFSVIDIRIDASAQAASSMTHAINVSLADTLTGDVEALGVHGEIDVIHQHTISSWTTLDQAGADAEALRVTSGPTYTAGIDGNTIFVADDDAIWLCQDSGTFDHLQVILSTVGSGPAQLTFKYYSTAGGGTWVAFAPIDETHGFTQNGLIIWEAGDLSNWDATGDPAGGSGEEGYWIEIARTRNTLPTTPVVTTIKAAAATEYKWDKSGDLNINSLSLNDNAVFDSVPLTLTGYANGVSVGFYAAHPATIFPAADNSCQGYWAGYMPSGWTSMTNPTLVILFTTTGAGDTITFTVQVDATAKTETATGNNLYNASLDFTTGAANIWTEKAITLTGTITAEDIIAVNLDKTSTDTRACNVGTVIWIKR